MKAVITRDLRLQGGALVRNLEFLRFAHHWGFTPRACRPYRAQTKGKVERPVRYLREQFRLRPHVPAMMRISISSGSTGSTRVANVRVHATTRERPRDRFDRDERLLLQPLAPRAAIRRWSSCRTRRAASRRPRRRGRSSTVEKRPLAVYARLAGGLA